MTGSHYLAPLFAPKSVAVIGASERPESIGAVLMRNLLETPYAGRLFAVDPAHREVFGLPCFPSWRRSRSGSTSR